MQKTKNKLCSLLLVAVMIFVCGCVNGETESKKENLEGAIAMNEQFSSGGFSIKVSAAYKNPLEVSPQVGKKILTIEIEYSPIGGMKSSDLTLHELDTTSYNFYSLDGLDYLGTAIPSGKTPFIRFLVNENSTQFVLYFNLDGEAKRVHIISGEMGDGNVPLPVPPEEVTGNFNKLNLSSKLYGIKKSRLTSQEHAVAVSLQGITAQTEAAIFIDIDNYAEYTDALLKRDGNITLTYVDDVWQLVKIFKNSIRDGSFITYNFEAGDAGINMAATVSAADGYLGVPKSLQDKAVAAGLNLKRDLTAIKGTNAERQRVIFNEYKGKLNKFLVVHQLTSKNAYLTQLRDLGIAQKCLTIFTDESAEDRQFRREVLAWADKNIPIIGWTTDEISFVSDVSSFGDFVLPGDWASNQSLLMAIEQEEIRQKNHDEQIKAASGNHYAALVVSDGDNMQWVQRDFSNSSHFGQRQRGNKNYKISWTFPPYMSQFNPFGAAHIYNKASDNDYFIAGVSGVGYMNMSTYPLSALSGFTLLTSREMAKTDLNVVTLLDNQKNIPSNGFARERLDYYAAYDNIKGGIWELDPDRYEAGKGKIYYSSNGKPFISVKLSLWHPTGNGANVTDEWLRQNAAKVNAYPTDITLDSAFSVINIHPWSVSMANVERFVELLSPHVQLVSAGELIDLVKLNVK